MIQKRSVITPNITEIHAHFLAILPTIEQYAELAHRHLVNFYDQEDAIAETIALAWAWYYQLARQGRHVLLSPTMLAHYAIRSVRARRLLCWSNGVYQRNSLLVSKSS